MYKSHKQHTIVILLIDTGETMISELFDLLECMII